MFKISNTTNFQNYEVIIVDNYSTDNTSKVVKNLEKKLNISKLEIVVLLQNQEI